MRCQKRDPSVPDARLQCTAARYPPLRRENKLDTCSHARVLIFSPLFPFVDVSSSLVVVLLGHGYLTQLTNSLILNEQCALKAIATSGTWKMLISPNKNSRRQNSTFMGYILDCPCKRMTKSIIGLSRPSSPSTVLSQSTRALNLSSGGRTPRTRS